MKHNGQILRSLAAVVFLVAIASISLSYGQTPQPQPASPEPQRGGGGGGGDPIRQLNLTPEQREQIRSIRQETNAERGAINRRVGEANRALEVTLDSDNPDEATIEPRIRALAAAQADALRMRISTELKIRRVLTVEQRILLSSLHQQAREPTRDRLEIRDQRQRRQEERPNILRNQRNGIGPLLPGRNMQRKPRP